jgi:uncharacterized protein
VPQDLDLRLFPEALDEQGLRQAAARRLGIPVDRLSHVQLLRRSVDARKSPPRFVLRLRAWVDEPFEPETPSHFPLQDVSRAPEIPIIGLGPAGLFAALHLIRLGLRPVVIERGKPVRARRRDLAALNREGIVDPDSNYCFGEGGAGTFSDGKLYTRATKRGDVRRVLDVFHQFGASPDILIDSHPHIGTNKLPGIIGTMREAILAAGGLIRFETKLTGLTYEHGRLSSLTLNGNERLTPPAVILATGHSARDVFRLLHEAGIPLEAKPFALGVRVEHPQALIDQIQYSCQGPRHENLPAASYNLVTQVHEKGVYSFCMCPGGIICPAATAPGEIVVNGWSPSKRNSPYANSGMVVEVALADMQQAAENPLAGVAFQQAVEQAAFAAGGGGQVAPAQRLTDFVAGRASATLPGSSYLPGMQPSELGAVLPPFVYERQIGRAHV